MTNARSKLLGITILTWTAFGVQAQDLERPPTPVTPPSGSVESGTKAAESRRLFISRQDAIWTVTIGEATATYPILGRRPRVRKVIGAPARDTYILLVQQTINLGDWSSQLVLLDLSNSSEPPVLRLLYGSFGDRWTPGSLLENAAERGGMDPRSLPDNDIVDILFGVDGKLYFLTEDEFLFRVTEEDGRVTRLDVVTEIAPAPTTPIELKTIDGKEGYAIDLEGK